MVPISILVGPLVLALSWGRQTATDLALPDSQRVSASCSEILSRPTRDSVERRLVISAFELSRTPGVPAQLGPLLVAGIRQSFKIAEPLIPSVFDTPDSLPHGAGHFIGQTIEGRYVLTLTRTGHVENARVWGGTRDEVLDSAILSAASALDTSGALLPSLAGLGDDSVSVLVTVMTADRDSAYRKRGPRPISPAADLLSFKSPLRKLDSDPASLPGNPNPDYPERERRFRMEGRVEVLFVIEPSGVADPRSVMVVWASTTPFARAALEALSGYRFKPAIVAGCAARMLVKLPFEFRLRPLSPF